MAEHQKRSSVRKLKPGPGLSPEAVYVDQRRRLRRAAIELTSEIGVRRVTVRALSQRAGVSTRTFYRHFANVSDCIGFAGEATLCDALQCMEEAAAPVQGREAAVNAAIASLLSYLAANPEAASVALIGVFDADSSTLARVEAASRTLEPFLATLLVTESEPDLVPHGLLIGMVAGVLRIARETFIAGRADELPATAQDLSSWLLALSAGRGEQPQWPAGTRPAKTRREADPLPDGRGYREAKLVGDNRRRILRATVRLAGTDGFANLTIPRIRRVAEVSRRSFDAEFSGVSECFLAALEWLAGAAAARARACAAAEKDLVRHTRRILVALAAQTARNDALASLILVEILAPGRDGLLHREAMIDAAAAALQRDLTPESSGREVALSASAAAVWEIAAAHVAAGRSSRVPSLAPLLVSLVLLPLDAA